MSLKNVHEKILMVLKGKVGFDFEKFDSCMENGVGSMLVEADEKLAREYDVYAVPTSFIGTIRVQGVGEVPQLLTLIRQQI